MRPSATHETGHSYFAQTGHSHFAATAQANPLCGRQAKCTMRETEVQIGNSGKNEVKSWVNTRRSQRVVARVRVLLRRRTDGDHFMEEVSHTLVVNAHGALIGLAMKVQPNELLAIKHMNSGEEKHSRVVRVGEETDSRNEIAIEFTEPAPRFWHIDFPPADWKVLQD
jgi:hypothetical protein